MALPVNITNSPYKFEFLASSARTTSGQSSAFDVGEWSEGILVLDVTAVSGSTPTLDVKVQVSVDGGTTWADLPSSSFAQKTATGKEALKIDKFGEKIRIDYVIGGSTPSFTFSVKAVLK